MRHGYNFAFLARFNFSWNRRIPLKGQMRPRGVIIFDVVTQDTPKMILAEHDHMVETLPANRPDHVFTTDPFEQPEDSCDLITGKWTHNITDIPPRAPGWPGKDVTSGCPCVSASPGASGGTFVFHALATCQDLDHGVQKRAKCGDDLTELLRRISQPTPPDEGIPLCQFRRVPPEFGTECHRTWWNAGAAL